MLDLPPLGAVRAEIARRKAEREREDVEQHAAAIRARCESLYGFVQEAWHVLEPETRFAPGWHIEAICQHLEAITWGTFLKMGRDNRLLINVPPGSMKSLIVSVLWPAWEWGPCGMPHLRYFTTSYKEDYVKRDSRRMRDLVQSDWYQRLWGDTIRLVRSGELSFANDATGWREGVTFTSLTGGRGDRLIIDDPHSTEGAESDTDREKATRIFRESATNRLNNPRESAIVVIMQRLHHEDISGIIDKQRLGYVHLMIPMEFEPDRKCRTCLGWEDPRSFEDELMWPEHYPATSRDRDKAVMGSFAWAGQYQQRPTPREGGMFKRHWFEGKIVDQEPAGVVWVRHWDLASTTKSRSARTAGVKIGRLPDGSYIVGHSVTEREEGDKVRRLIKTQAELDGTAVMISLPQDPGQAGKVQAKDYVKMLAGYNARARPESGDKTVRAEPFAAQCEAGNVAILRGPWNGDYLDELCAFPGGGLADQVDASSGAFARLIDMKDDTPAEPIYAAEFYGRPA